ncbi:MAG: hypothetical protein D3916_14030 [Candidatus Electrothrix sp. MAN1_4]|nr:hypothetical protein [Candidatus Electrothrix sp. MAN1_4]
MQKILFINPAREREGSGRLLSGLFVLINNLPQVVTYSFKIFFIASVYEEGLERNLRTRFRV